MTSTFFLKRPKSEKETLIIFSCYFKSEGKKFLYSTGEKIKPINWDQQNKQPILKGKHKTASSSIIKLQLNRYPDAFELIQNRCKAMGEDFTSQILKREFDTIFKKAPTGKNTFYDAFDEFMDYKIKMQEWSPSTIKRYKNIKNILQDFEKQTSYNLTFSNINEVFHADFTDYCMNIRGHINNTYSRNLGLFKTFMFWALKKGYTYNNIFLSFEKKKRVVTKQIALTKIDLQNLMHYDFKNERLKKVRDVFVFSCVTGMRFGELQLFEKEDIVNNSIVLKEEKDTEKESRAIPLNEISLHILRKYDYQLPLIANQKQNEYIKEVFKKAGYTDEVVKTTTKGKENIRVTMPYYERISTHTARRTFITMMKKEGLSDKLIASITGHRDMKTLNQYYQVDDASKVEAVNEVFNMDIGLLKRVN
ncbi:tyrosine-type recombinase/integrase [Aquimarina mytili]|uniref:Tyrosine-type recombinase/integrase n=1 Tax=Aquimarina mytili TaxID=874423 RepID=A0A937A4N8_9FLAO|nr:tyrosine-type recombinase/integrase [Aquimarina mytili]MBL0684860.1 tyrosine-type recombinase/integrase [Aquimarina mytili]